MRKPVKTAATVLTDPMARAKLRALDELVRRHKMEFNDLLWYHSPKRKDNEVAKWSRAS